MTSYQSFVLRPARFLCFLCYSIFPTGEHTKSRKKRLTPHRSSLAQILLSLRGSQELKRLTFGGLEDQVYGARRALRWG